MSEPESKISRRELLKRAAPLGKVTIDKTGCTGCELCVSECPTGALSISVSENDVYQLLFRHAACIACGRCGEVCPEGCLHLERTIELDKIKQPAEALFEDKVARCRQCGEPIGTEAMIAKMRTRVSAAEESVTANLNLCPMCKIKVSFGTGVNSGRID